MSSKRSITVPLTEEFDAHFASMIWDSASPLARKTLADNMVLRVCADLPQTKGIVDRFLNLHEGKIFEEASKREETIALMVTEAMDSPEYREGLLASTAKVFLDMVATSPKIAALLDAVIESRVAAQVESLTAKFDAAVEEAAEKQLRAAEDGLGKRLSAMMFTVDGDLYEHTIVKIRARISEMVARIFDNPKVSKTLAKQIYDAGQETVEALVGAENDEDGIE